MPETSNDALYKISVRLWVSEFDCDPDAISQHLDLIPHHVVRKGQIFPPPRDPAYRAKRNTWVFGPEPALPVPLPHCIEITQLLLPMRTALQTRLDRLATLPEGTASISVYVLPWQAVPAFAFKPEDMRFLSLTGLPFDIDIQNFGDEGE